MTFSFGPIGFPISFPAQWVGLGPPWSKNKSMACNCLTDEPTNCVPSWSKCPTVWPRKWRVEKKRSGGEEQWKMVETSQWLSQKFAHPWRRCCMSSGIYHADKSTTWVTSVQYSSTFTHSLSRWRSLSHHPARVGWVVGRGGITDLWLIFPA